MTRHLVSGLLVVLAALSLSACDDELTDVDPRSVSFDSSLGVDLDAMIRKPSGLYYQDVQVGSAPTAMPGRDVAVFYKGWLSDGFLFDETANPDQPFVFRLGFGHVIAGWDEGVAGMRTGGVRRLVIPPSLGYGDRMIGPIPANSVLVFEIRLEAVF